MIEPSDPATSAARPAAGEIVVEQLTWTPDGRREPTLRDVTLRIPAGARVGLFGASGSGKSTLLRALAGVLAESGTGVLSGRLEVPLAGLMLQDPRDAIVADTVGRDVAFGPENLGLPRPQIWERVTNSLAAVDFPYEVSRPTTALSGGQQQRLALAGALAGQARVLLLDEPTAMLDDAASRQVREAVADAVKASGATLIVVEHRMAPWLDLLDHAILLGPGGQVVACGPIDQVLTNHQEAVAATGVWLPGTPAPRPVPLPSGLLAPVSDQSAPDQMAPDQPDPDAPEPDQIAPFEAPAPVVSSQDAAVRRGSSLVGGGDLQVNPGQVLALTGPSGAGKSTTLHLLVGAAVPDRGSVTPSTAELPSRELAELIAYVPQHPSLGFTATTVREEVSATPRALGVTVEADRVLDHFGLLHLADASPYSLSGGEQRRLNLAAAVVSGSRALALDEPSVGQDRHTWAMVAGTVVSAAAAGRAVVMATHDEELIRLADQRVQLTSPPTHAAPDGPVARQRAVTRCRPLALLAAGLMVAAASLLISTPLLAAVGIGMLALTLPWYAPAPRAAGRRALPVLLALVSVGWSAWLLGGRDIQVAGVAMARVLCMVLPGVFLMAHIRPSALGDDLGQRVRLPARAVVACVVAMQRLDHLLDLWHQLGQTRRVRGLQASRFDVIGKFRDAVAQTFSLLVESLRAANITAVAMDARGFGAARDRTWAEPSVWAGRDTAAVLIAVAYGVVILALRSLSVAT